MSRSRTPVLGSKKRLWFRSRLELVRLEERTVFSAAFAPNELLVQYAPVDAAQPKVEAVAVLGATLIERVHSNAMVAAGDGVLERIRLPQGLSVAEAAQRLSSVPGVLFAEPNYLHTAAVVSNDTYYTSGQLWGMYSDDSPTAIGGAGTTNTFGSQAEEAWNDGNIGSDSVYVGIIDEGFQYAHPDLDGNSWTNPFDLVDGVDNDGNGKIDDVHGWDFYSNNNSVYDGTGDDHGTHVAGTIGAEGGNGAGVAGVNWNVTMISAKFLGPNGGYTSGAVEALDYLTDLKTRHGINIVATNNSWGGGGYSQSLHAAINRAAKQGILFVAAAGNAGTNNDTSASYPANYNTTQSAGSESAASYDAVISVASITSTGARSSFSSYGATTVDLGAPGSGIVSTVPTNNYASYSGTSMATPHVTGAIALYAAKYPTATAAQIRSAILASATPTSSLNGITVTGGRLNVQAALQIAPGIGMSIDDITKNEGHSGTTEYTFTVTLTSAPTQGTVTVNYATANGSATFESGDYAETNGSLSFSASDTSKTVTVYVNGDVTVESTESFSVVLSNVSGASITDGTGTGTITNDDFPPATFSINDISFVERNSGTRVRNFTVTLSTALTQTAYVNFATENASTGNGFADTSDYVAKSGTLTFAPGVTTQTIGITIKGDRTIEPNEVFFVNLSAPVNATIADGQGQATILNDDTGGAGGGDGPGGASLGGGAAGNSLLWQYLNSGRDVFLEQFGNRSVLSVLIRGNRRIRVLG